VVNTWLNRMVSDAQGPAAKRFAKTNVPELSQFLQ
jgi:hypothetical protein